MNFPLFSGYECESYNNPADFVLDIINGDSTAISIHSFHRKGTDAENPQPE